MDFICAHEPAYFKRLCSHDVMRFLATTRREYQLPGASQSGGENQSRRASHVSGETQRMRASAFNEENSIF